MQKFEVGDKVLVEAEIVDKSEVNPNKYQIDIDCYEYSSYAWVNGKNIHPDDIVTKTYEDGMAEAWKTARQIMMFEKDGGLSLQEVVEIFGAVNFADVFKNFTATEAAEKIKAWEDAIHVRDEVKNNDGSIGVITKDDPRVPNGAHVLWKDGRTSTIMKEYLTKTGRKINVDKWLAEIGRWDDMPTYHGRRLKPCKTCGTKPVLEHWASGGPKYAVRCNNPDRPDSCDKAFYYSMYRNPDEAIRRWNEYQEIGGIE